MRRPRAGQRAPVESAILLVLAGMVAAVALTALVMPLLRPEPAPHLVQRQGSRPPSL